MIYDAKYFHLKFEVIPDKYWVSGAYWANGEKYCAYSHCDPDEQTALFSVLPNIMGINDGHHIKYRHIPTPKQRVLAALEDVIQKECKQLLTI